MELALLCFGIGVMGLFMVFSSEAAFIEIPGTVMIFLGFYLLLICMNKYREAN
jgi:membrane-bound ClpP family serine protease